MEINELKINRTVSSVVQKPMQPQMRIYELINIPIPLFFKAAL